MKEVSHRELCRKQCDRDWGLFYEKELVPETGLVSFRILLAAPAVGTGVLVGECSWANGRPQYAWPAKPR